jgi:hypothetical protein
MRFRHLEKFKTGGSGTKMELSIPLPKSPKGMHTHGCPNPACTPGRFQMDPVPPDQQAIPPEYASRVRRMPRTPGMTCPYCGQDADDREFIAKDDIDHARKTVEVAATNDVADAFADIMEDAFGPLNRSSGGFISFSVNVKRGRRRPLPVARRDDLLREARCPVCHRRYGVYAIGLFCPDCGSANVSAHFQAEVELIRESVTLTQAVEAEGKAEHAYRLLGDAHENVVTALETYLKHVYRFVVGHRFPEEAEKRCSKEAIGNAFQNIAKARKLFAPLGLDPFASLSAADVGWIEASIAKRHVLGHNLGMADAAYVCKGGGEAPGQTVRLGTQDVLRFANLAAAVVHGLESLPEFLPPARGGASPACQPESE